MTNRPGLGNSGTMFTSRMAAKVVMGFTFLTLLSVGSLPSSAVYSSRQLNQRDTELYDSLRRQGHLDLLYFIIEKRVEPFEGATALWHKNRRLFNEVTALFLKKINL